MTTKNPEVRFGTLAVEKGFITGGQLGKAVSVQMKEDLTGLKHRLIGEILVDMGFMNTSQVNEMLETMSQK